MYTIRTVRTNHDSYHQFLGTNYRLLLRGDTLSSEEVFISNFKFHSKTKNIDLIAPYIVGMIYHDGEEFPIESDCDYYIMGPNGKTLQHIRIEQSKDQYKEVVARISKIKSELLTTDEIFHLTNQIEEGEKIEVNSNVGFFSTSGTTHTTLFCTQFTPEPNGTTVQNRCKKCGLEHWQHFKVTNTNEQQ